MKHCIEKVEMAKNIVLAIKHDLLEMIKVFLKFDDQEFPLKNDKC